jgi:hypothetical protein
MSVCKSQEMIKPPTLKGMDRHKFISQLEVSTLRPAPPKHTQRVEDLYLPVFSNIQAGKKDPAVVMKPLADQIRKILGTK